MHQRLTGAGKQRGTGGKRVSTRACNIQPPSRKCWNPKNLLNSPERDSNSKRATDVNIIIWLDRNYSRRSWQNNTRWTDFLGNMRHLTQMRECSRAHKAVSAIMTKIYDTRHGRETSFQIKFWIWPAGAPPKQSNLQSIKSAKYHRGTMGAVAWK